MKHNSHIGRNDPCPCGSGKKYKKCHGLKQATSKGNTLMLIVVGLLVIAGATAVIRSFTSDKTHTGSTTGVWSPEHGHYH